MKKFSRDFSKNFLQRFLAVFIFEDSTINSFWDSSRISAKNFYKNSRYFNSDMSLTIFPDTFTLVPSDVLLRIRLETSTGILPEILDGIAAGFSLKFLLQLL